MKKARQGKGISQVTLFIPKKETYFYRFFKKEYTKKEAFKFSDVSR